MTSFIYGCFLALAYIIGFYLGRRHQYIKTESLLNRVDEQLAFLDRSVAKKEAEFALREEILRFKEKESSHCD